MSLSETADTGNGEAARTSPGSKDATNSAGDSAQVRSTSVSRRASMPAPREPVKAPVTEKAQAPQTESAHLRRASVGSGMLSAPFQKTPKESPRWRQATLRSQLGKFKADQLDSAEQADRLIAEESMKTINQRIFEKTAVSIALGLFVIFICFSIGSFFRLILNRDLGFILIWLNQISLVLIFLFDKRRETDEKRMDNLNAFETLTLVCQVLPWLWTYWFYNSYYTVASMILIHRE
jgi:hypothetical protein